MISFKDLFPFEKRKMNSEIIRNKYPDKIPVICEKNNKNTPNIDKNKYLIPLDLSLGQFMNVIRKRIKLNSSIALYIFIDGNIPSNTQLLSVLYDDYKDKDGFLYMIYDIENTFGSLYDFKKNDNIYLIKDNIIDKSITYTIHSIEIIKEGDWHDGYSDTYYGLLENNITKIIEKKLLAYINLMCQIQDIYAIKI